MKRFLTTAILSLLCIAAAAQQKYNFKQQISYTTSNDAYAQQRCKLDVHYPEGAKDAPVLVWFHGGGLTGGNTFLPVQFKEQGIIVVCVNYRLMPKATIADCIDDSAAAVAWAFRHAAEYGGDPKKVFVTGHSAGGYLTSMIGLDKKWLNKYGIDANDIAGLIPLSGQCITHFAQRNLQGIGPLQATIDEYAPLTYVRGDAAPMLIISGDREMEMNGRYEEQAYFWRMLKLCGHKDVHILEMQGYDHGAMANPGFPLVVKFVKERSGLR